MGIISVTVILGVLMTVVALKLAEGAGGIEFDGWGGVFGAAVMCWLAGWCEGTAFHALIPPRKLVGSPLQLMALSFGSALGGAIVGLLVAWAVVPGARVRRLAGLIFAAILIVGLQYAASALLATALSMGL